VFACVDVLWVRRIAALIIGKCPLIVFLSGPLRIEDASDIVQPTAGRSQLLGSAATCGEDAGARHDHRQCQQRPHAPSYPYKLLKTDAIIPSLLAAATAARYPLYETPAERFNACVASTG